MEVAVERRALFSGLAVGLAGLVASCSTTADNGPVEAQPGYVDPDVEHQAEYLADEAQSRDDELQAAYDAGFQDGQTEIRSDLEAECEEIVDDSLDEDAAYDAGYEDGYAAGSYEVAGGGQGECDGG